MDRRLERQPHTDMTGNSRVADAEAGDREHLVRETQNFADGGGMIANDADRATAEPDGFGRQNKALQDQRRIDCGVEESFELAVLLRVAAQFANSLQAASIAAKDQELR